MASTLMVQIEAILNAASYGYFGRSQCFRLSPGYFLIDAIYINLLSWDGFDGYENQSLIEMATNWENVNISGRDGLLSI